MRTSKSSVLADLVIRNKFKEGCTTLMSVLVQKNPQLDDIFLGKTLMLYRPMQRFILENMRNVGRSRGAVVLQCVIRVFQSWRRAKRRHQIRHNLLRVLRETRTTNDEDGGRATTTTTTSRDKSSSLREAISATDTIEGCRWPQLLEARAILRNLERREQIGRTLLEQLRLWGVHLGDSGVEPSSYGRSSDFRADDYLPRLLVCIDEAISMDYGTQGSEEHHMVQAARSVCDAATERTRARSIIREALAGSTRSILLNALESIRSVVQRYGENFLETDVRRVHTMLTHIEQEKLHVSALRSALASSGIRGAVGRLNTEHMNFSELQTAIKRCSHSALKTVQARSLLRVAKALYEVRHAVSQNDWPRCYDSFTRLTTTIESVKSLVSFFIL
jgi:hypothetical protein